MENLNQKPDSNKDSENEPVSESGWKQWAPLAILLVAAAIVGWQLGQPKSPTPEISKDIEESQDLASQESKQNTSLPPTEISKPTTVQDNKPQTPPAKTTGNIRMEGTLLPSDNPSLGNVIIKVGDNQKYLWTREDIRPLINKTVVVEGSGTMENFTIVDITPTK